LIRSFLGTSLIEYPGRISSVVFFGGCNLYCPFCHNPELVRPDLLGEQYSPGEDDILDMLSKRAGFIDGISVTGGEPLLYPGLPAFLERIKRQTGLLVKLDTNGTLPDRLRSVLPLVDYVAMDLKASPSRYMEATGGRASFGDVQESAAMIRELPDAEFRTTMVPGLVVAEDLLAILDAVGPVSRYALQRFRPGKTLSPDFAGIASYPADYMERAAELISPRVGEVMVRN
jgi:pyruvate formate lyase activating enzyme